jgi:multiple sugar transport system permease protein
MASSSLTVGRRIGDVLLGRNRVARHARNEFARRLFAYLFTTILALMFAMPFFWMVSSSLKSISDLAEYPPKLIPAVFVWSNYPEALRAAPFGIYFLNTIKITALGMLGQVFSGSLVAYGFARLRFKGSGFWFMVLLSTMMLPQQVTLIPQYLLFRELGWLNTIAPLVVPAYFGTPFYIFLLRQFFMTIPKELDEAAIVDGCGRFGIFWRIIIPLSRPILTTIVAFSFIAHWNDFFGPLIYLTDPKTMTVAVGLLTFKNDTQTLFHLLMAASTIALVPVVIVFFIAQRYFVSSITMTGLKEG